MNHQPPQFDLPWTDEPFRLAQQTALDGERLATQKAQREFDRRQAEAAQTLSPVLAQVIHEANNDRLP